jgi:hypothetical protein
MLQVAGYRVWLEFIFSLKNIYKKMNYRGKYIIFVKNPG